MPDYVLRIAPRAAREIQLTRNWYDARNPVSGQAFIEELETALNGIVRSPSRWPRFSPTVRRYVLPRFPFNILYRVRNDEVVVVAVAHQRRRPGYWEVG